MIWRHGDVLIASVPSLPARAKASESAILVHGELTGHSHRILERSAAELWELDGSLYLKVIADKATVVHQEHGPITLPRGSYRVWIQREYTPATIRRVAD